MTIARQNKLLVISFGLLVVCLAGLGLYANSGNTFDVDQDLFRVGELSAVDRVDLQSTNGNVSLTFDGTRWMVNDRYDADRQMIKVLFATLDQVIPKRPVSKSQESDIMKSLQSQGVKISLFAGGQLQKDFLVGGNAAKTEAYFMRAEEVPYLVSIPGYRVYAAGVFEQSESEWRDKRVFDFNWRNFKDLAVTFARTGADDFRITMQDRSYGLEGMAQVDTARLNDYLDAISLLNASRFYKQGKTSRFDSLLRLTPSFSIEVHDVASRAYRLDIFPPLVRENNVIGKIDGEPALFDKRDIIQIAKKKSFFSKNRANTK